MVSKTRTCIACRKKATKDELIRIVSIDKKPVIDKNGKINSRAIYLCNNKECYTKLLKSKNLSRTIKIDVKETDLEKC